MLAPTLVLLLCSRFPYLFDLPSAACLVLPLPLISVLVTPAVPIKIVSLCVSLRSSAHLHPWDQQPSLVN